MPVSVYSSRHRSTGMTQEKTRLMKALELRKKQQQAQADKLAKAAEDAAAKEKAEAEESHSKEEENVGTEDATPQTAASGSIEDASSKSPEKQEQHGDNESSFSESIATSHLESSGMVFAGSLPESDDLNSTVSVSSPISAQTHGSSAAPSTRPSSVSDDENHAVEGIQKSSTIHEPSKTSPVESIPTIVSEEKTPTFPTDTQTQLTEQPLAVEQAADSNTQAPPKTGELSGFGRSGREARPTFTSTLEARIYDLSTFCRWISSRRCRIKTFPTSKQTAELVRIQGKTPGNARSTSD